MPEGWLCHGSRLLVRHLQDLKSHRGERDVRRGRDGARFRGGAGHQAPRGRSHHVARQGFRGFHRSGAGLTEAMSSLGEVGGRLRVVLDRVEQVVGRFRNAKDDAVKRRRNIRTQRNQKAGWHLAKRSTSWLSACTARSGIALIEDYKKSSKKVQIY